MLSKEGEKEDDEEDKKEDEEDEEDKEDEEEDDEELRDDERHEALDENDFEASRIEIPHQESHPNVWKKFFPMFRKMGLPPYLASVSYETLIAFSNFPRMKELRNKWVKRQKELKELKKVKFVKNLKRCKRTKPKHPRPPTPHKKRIDSPDSPDPELTIHLDTTSSSEESHLDRAWEKICVADKAKREKKNQNDSDDEDPPAKHPKCRVKLF